MRWLRIASFMGLIHNIIWRHSSFTDELYQLSSFELADSAHVMPLVCIKHINFINLAVRGFQLDLLSKVVHPGRVTLLHNDLHNVLSFELLPPDDWDELDDNLSNTWITY
jgi:hypothetical protein